MYGTGHAALSNNSIAAGGVLEGIPGAVLAVPFVAVVYAVARTTHKSSLAGDLIHRVVDPDPNPVN